MNRLTFREVARLNGIFHAFGVDPKEARKIYLFLSRFLPKSHKVMERIYEEILNWLDIKFEKRRSPDYVVSENRKVEVEVRLSQYKHPSRYCDEIVCWVADREIKEDVILTDIKLLYSAYLSERGLSTLKEVALKVKQELGV